MLELKFKYKVQLIFCDPSQRELNKADDPKTFLKIVEKLVEAEQDNEERIQVSTARMKERVARGYYPFYPHQGYKRTESQDGLHIPDGSRFLLLQQALKSVARLDMTPKQATSWLKSKRYRTPKGGHVLDLDRFSDILQDPYYAGILEVSDWPINESGLHQPMITREEYEINCSIAAGRPIRKKDKYNPKFPLNLNYHDVCSNSDGKLCGVNHSNGKGWSREEYRCRNCQKAMPATVIHDSFENLLASLKPQPGAVEQLIEATKTAWELNEEIRVDTCSGLRLSLKKLEEKQSDQLDLLTRHADLEEEIKAKLLEIKAQKVSITKQILEIEKQGSEYDSFLEYALRYVEDLRGKWSELTPERRHECKQVFFKNEIFISDSGKVYTPFISPIYRSLAQKSSVNFLTEVNSKKLVELPGIAPGSEK